jgi:YrbI family 3-deoxy-D-manno-octulosonate 8-phosphate phosphatase
MNNTEKRIREIKLVVTDVDGVLTDGGFYYSEEGILLKKFNVKDGMGMRLLKQEGFVTGIITTDKTSFIKARAERMKPDFLITGTWDKLGELKKKLDELSFALENVAYIGDDVNDIEILKAVGFSAAPSDAVNEVLEIADYVCKRGGGKGAFREFADIIIKARKNNFLS